MESSNNYTAAPRKPRTRVRAARHGKITLVSLVAILALAVMIGFVGNAGHVVTTKVNSQNAADAIAFSSAQWMARGMNAVTATNHLLGEVTGLVVVIEGLGGPEADHDMVAYPPHSQITDSVNQTLTNMAIINGLPVYGATAARNVDKIFVEAVVLKLVSRKDAKHKAFATIYDSKLVLKKATTKRLFAKFVANWGLFVPPPWGWLSAIPAYGVHIVMNKQLLEIGIEYVILEGLERLVILPPIRQLKVSVIENKLIPALAAHGDYLAGLPPKKAKDNPAAQSGVVNSAIRESLDHFREVYQVKAAIYPTATTLPLLTTLRLPIVAEPAPSGRGTREGKEEKEWGDDELIAVDKDDPLKELQEKIDDNKRKTQQRINELRRGVEFLRTLHAEIEDLKKRTGVNQEERDAFKIEQDKINDAIAAKEKLLQERIEDLKKLEAEEKKMKDALAQLDEAPGGSGNISARRAHLALEAMNQAEERNTQWVRATYPYVDGFRAPILKLFRNNLKRSEAEKHYKKWTDRYTLTKAWQFRSGFRFEKTGESTGKWRKDPKTEPLRMYVMVERFVADTPSQQARPGTPRVAKGEEVWTKDTAAGKKMAEEMFTIVGMTHRDIEPLFSPIIYPVASENGITTFAQAIYYNSNEQQPAPAGSTTQAKAGWDTLNWDPAASPPEWGATATVSDRAKWPWDIFQRDEKFLGKAGARLNWQAKLMPVTKSRFKQAFPAAATTLDPGMVEDVTAAWGLFDNMVTH